MKTTFLDRRIPQPKAKRANSFSHRVLSWNPFTPMMIKVFLAITGVFFLEMLEIDY